ncbi:U4/U6.U5 small nuclear ribonucleoprotein 27 kDa protein-like [Symsagittifera roscoffensis]|uniref:U4/U6.U5 small nuclear ribonucleoprotein 27 kDa protein-like n=1 Tax=Symsagittifera roscoffensis TaxID=84072 RepID=UPI00307CA6BE
MPRSRSRSPARNRHRHRSKSPDHRSDRSNRDRHDRGQRDRSRSPRRRSKSPNAPNRPARKEAFRGPDLQSELEKRNLSAPIELVSNHKVSKNVVAVDELSEADKEMMKTMGFCAFDTTKNAQTEEADNQSAAAIATKRNYRQYMNRKGGFNRPLDFVA